MFCLCFARHDIYFFWPIEFSTLFHGPNRPQRQYVPAKAVPPTAKKRMMCLGRKNWKKGGVVAMVGLECDDDNCDWKRGKSKRRRFGVRTEIGDNFSLRFFGVVSRRRGWVVWLRMHHVELRFKILGQVRMHMFGKYLHALNTTQAGYRTGPDWKTVDYWRHGHGS